MMDMVEEELRLEQETLAAGIQKYRDNLSIRGQEASQPGQRLMVNVTEQLVVAIEESLKTATAARRGRRASVIPKLVAVGAPAMALLTARSLVQSIGESLSITQAAKLIGGLVAEHDDWTRLLEQHAGLAYVVGERLKTSSSERHRRAVTRHVVTKFSESRWTDMDKLTAGMWLLELALSATPIVKKAHTYNAGTKKSKTYLEPTPETLAYLEDGHSRCESLSLSYMPMVCPPQPWSTPYSGGYLQRRVKVIKVRDKAYVESLREKDISPVYRALNALQETPYRINASVLAIMERGWDENARLPGFVDREQIPLPNKPVDIETNVDAKNAWKRQAAEIHKTNASLIGSRVSLSLKLNVAKRFSKYPEIYFPHTLDWRGRAYPLPVFINPQGDDMSKALLQFAEGKPLGEEGVLWFKVHIANLFGVDKVSFGDRIRWVDEHASDLIASGMDPDVNLFWQEADKPWQALAACLEFVGYSIMGEDYVSHLPVAMDGSCNGLQHLSALLRDEVGGAATNLVPAGKPSDIYTQVSARVVEKLTAQASDALNSEQRHTAQLLLDMGISRKLVKRPVMTKPYGVTRFGMRDQLKGEIASQGLIANPQPWLQKDTDEPKRAVHYAARALGPIVNDAIGETVVGAKVVMDWLQTCAQRAAAVNLPLHWETPTGLLVVQQYYKMGRKKTTAQIGGFRVELNMTQETDNIDARRQSAGMSPNVIHSLDAAHMMWTVLSCLDHGITDLAMVHDSYATHACNVGDMNALLRHAFVELYSVDVLQDLYQQFVQQTEGTDVEIPPPPALGSLDISLVEDSLYFFA